MSSYSSDYKLIHLRDASVRIPVKWSVKKNNNCLLIRNEQVKLLNLLKVCRVLSSEDSAYFTRNDDGEWEAVTDGIPVLADLNITSKFTGMSAIVSCKYKDDAGYHTEQCFQAEINLPQKINFIFTGRGDLNLFKDYKKVYLSFDVK